MSPVVVNVPGGRLHRWDRPTMPEPWEERERGLDLVRARQLAPKPPGLSPVAIVAGCFALIALLQALR